MPSSSSPAPIVEDIVTATVPGKMPNMARTLLLNLSGGAGDFKMLRGGVPTIEYDAVYHAHLPRHRRLPWRILRALFTESAVRKAHD